jgi:uncharacterized protein (DUF1501 family)
MTRPSTTTTRRDFLLRGLSGALLSPSLFGLLARVAVARQQQPRSNAKARRVVLLWLEGGPSQIDTFDPKPGSPNNGPFQSVPTDVKGWLFSEHLRGLASRAGRLAVVRTATSKEGSHARARELLHTGFTPTPAVVFPSLGTIAAHALAELEAEAPAFVQIDGPPARISHLGVATAPIGLASGALLNGVAPAGPEGADSRETKAASESRRDVLLAAIDDEYARRGARREVDLFAAMRRRTARLDAMKRRGVFDLAQEPDRLRNAYGRSNFGQSVLLARRLLEYGVTAVEVVLDGWDTHVDNFRRTRDLSLQLDPAFSALLDDLGTRGMLADTLVVCMGEFGRTPAINSSAGRHHWPGNYCVALAGGGVRGGTVVGETDEGGEHVVRDPVSVADLFATFAELFGANGAESFQTPSGRPVTLVDPKGVVVRSLLA